MDEIELHEIMFRHSPGMYLLGGKREETEDAKTSNPLDIQHERSWWFR